MITNLKTRINELEESQKKYRMLNQEYKKLEKDYALLTEKRLRLEYEIKQKKEINDKLLNDLKIENDNLNNDLTDKLCLNKKLCEDRQCLESQLNLKNSEIDEIKNNINMLTKKLNMINNNQNMLQNDLKNLNDSKVYKEKQIEDLINDNKKLVTISQNNEQAFLLSNQEKQKLSKIINDNNNNINSINIKLRMRGIDLKNLQHQLNSNSTLNTKLQKKNETLNISLENLIKENENLKNELFQEKSCFEEAEKENRDKKCVLNEKQSILRKLSSDYSNKQNDYEQMSEEKKMNQNMNESLQTQITNLTHQNQDLSCELNKIINEDDECIKNVSKRNERMSLLLKDNENEISQIPRLSRYKSMSQLPIKTAKMCHHHKHISADFDSNDIYKKYEKYVKDKKRCVSPNNSNKNFTYNINSNSSC